jgi:hypothetical protein
VNKIQGTASGFFFLGKNEKCLEWRENGSEMFSNLLTPTKNHERDKIIDTNILGNKILKIAYFFPFSLFIVHCYLSYIDA